MDEIENIQTVGVNETKNKLIFNMNTNINNYNELKFKIY